MKQHLHVRASELRVGECVYIIRLGAICAEEWIDRDGAKALFRPFLCLAALP